MHIRKETNFKPVFYRWIIINIWNTLDDFQFQNYNNDLCSVQNQSR